MLVYMGVDEPTHYPKNRAAWRRWLARNHDKVAVVHVVFYRKTTGQPSLSYDEAVEEALCFGWIDGVKRKLDAERYTYRFTPRRPKSKWSESNKARVAKLEAVGLIAPAGAAAIAEAKRNGSWNTSKRPNPSETPLELAAALRRSKAAQALYDALTPGHKRQWNAWIAEAKRPETRERRAASAIAALRAGATRPNA